MPTPIYFPPQENALQKTLDSDLSSGVTASLTLNNITNIQNKPGVLVVDRIDSGGSLKDAADREFIAYTGTSGSTLTGLTRGVGGSTDQDHSTGAVVEFVPDVVVFQMIADALDTVLDADDISALDSTITTLTGTQTLTNKTLTGADLTDSGNTFPDNVLKKIVNVVLVDNDTDTAIEDGVGGITFTVPEELNGWVLTNAHAGVETAGTTNTTDIQIHNATDSVDMLSTVITIDSTETSSYTAATAPVIDTGNDDVASGDQLRFDLDAVSSTAAKGLQVILTFEAS